DLYPGNSQDSRTVERNGTTYQMTPAASPRLSQEEYQLADQARDLLKGTIDPQVIADARKCVQRIRGGALRIALIAEIDHAEQSMQPPAEPAPAPDLADMILRIDAHGYAKSGTRQKGMTTYYSFRDFKADLADGDAGEIELAEGELPYWLAELDDNTARANERQARYLDAQQRFAVLGWDLRRNDKQFTLCRPDGAHYATTPTLEPQIKTLETLMRRGR